MSAIELRANDVPVLSTEELIAQMVALSQGFETYRTGWHAPLVRGGT